MVPRRTKPCPMCQGKGIVSAERDTIRMSREEIDAAREDAIPTPKFPPPPEQPIAVARIPSQLVPFIVDVEEDPFPSPLIERKPPPSIPSILLAVAIIAAAMCTWYVFGR